jgi:hypothetical protein
MPDEAPVACSLAAGDLARRLAEIAQIGAGSLIDRRAAEGGRQLLRFRADASTRRRLQAVIAAEAACCAFLDLSLGQDGDALVLSIAAPERGRELAEGLAATFGGAMSR